MTTAELSFYIATGLTNAAQHTVVAQALIAAGYHLTYDWTVHGSVRDQGFLRIREVAAHEHAGVAAADVLVALLPKGMVSSGRGTHVEIGMALALGKKVILWSDDPDLFDTGAKTCAFYHHPAVITITGKVDTVAAFIPMVISTAKPGNKFIVAGA